MVNLDRSGPDLSKSCFVFKMNIEPLVDRRFRKHFLDILFREATVAVFKFVIYLSYSRSFLRLVHLFHNVTNTFFLKVAQNSFQHLYLDRSL